MEKFNRTCAYCEKTEIPLEVEHVLAKSRGGTNRLSNLTIACRECNEEKDNLLLTEWAVKLKKKQNKRAKTILQNIATIEKRCQKPLKDATVVNVTRWKLYETLVSIFGKEQVEVGSGALTKMQRIQHNLPKEHYYDASCVGHSTPAVLFMRTNDVLQIKAKGRGSRFRSRIDAFGFPKSFMPKTKIIRGFISGDMVKAVVPKGKYKGTHYGTIAMRSTGRADIKNRKGICVAQGIDSVFAEIVQRFDGYGYFTKKRNTAIPLHS